MNQIDYVAKAKRLLGNTVRKTALVIVPLAAAINNLQATIVFPTGNPSCFTSGAAATGCFPRSGGASQLGDPGNGILGVSFFTTGPILLTSPSVPPGSTIDFNSTTNSPEPATVGLLGAAFAFIGLRKRGRKKNKTG